MPKRRDQGQGGLFYLKSRGLWRGIVDIGYDQDGKRLQRSVHARTQRACVEKLEALKREIAEHGAPLDKQVTVKAWADTWLETVAKVSTDPKTYATYASITRRWLVPTLGRKRVATLKPSDVRAVRTAIAEAGKSSSLARQAQVVLSMMLEAARADRITNVNVAESVKRVKAAPSSRGAIPTDQAVAILRAAAALPDGAGSRWWFKLLCGPRQGELLGATLADLDLERGVYTVAWKLEELVREHGCGGACGKSRGASCSRPVWRVPDGFESRHLEGRLHLTRPKSGGVRLVPLIPQMRAALERHLAATDGTPNPHGLIWRHSDGSPILPREDAQDWRALLVTAGLIDESAAVPGGTALTGHVARHTTVTILASLGVDFQVIGEIVGHSSEQVTRIYRHTMETEKRAAMEAIAGVWGEGLALPGGGVQGRPQTPTA